MGRHGGRSGWRRWSVLLGCVAWGLAVPGGGQPAPPRLLLAFASFRDRPLHPQVYFYEHDGAGEGGVAGGIEPANLRSDTRPTLTLGGKRCIWAAEQENEPGVTQIWDLETRKQVGPPPGLNSDVTEIEAHVSADGEWIAFSAWQRPDSPAGWNVFLYHLKEEKLVPFPVNTDLDEMAPTLSGDGRLVAFVSNRPGGGGLSDIYLLDRQAGALRSLPGLNTRHRELDPALSADGRYLAFTSDRPGGTGSLDVYLYDLEAGQVVPLPGLNGIGPDQTPALSPDGRYVAFTAERASGRGERDVYLYDRETHRLLPLPDLNTPSEDFDPAVTYR